MFNFITLFTGAVICSSIDMTNNIAKRQLTKIDTYVDKLRRTLDVGSSKNNEYIKSIKKEIELLNLSLEHATFQALGSGVSFIIINNFFLLLLFMLCFSIEFVKMESKLDFLDSSENLEDKGKEG